MCSLMLVIRFVFRIEAVVAHAVGGLVTAGLCGRMIRTVQEGVVNANVVRSALHAWQRPVNGARRAIGVDCLIESGAVDASAPRASLARALRLRV